MASVVDSVDRMIAASGTHGYFKRCYGIGGLTGTTTKGNSTSGYNSVERFPAVIVVPSMGAGVAGLYLTYTRLSIDLDGKGLVLALEFDLGTLTVATNTFSGGAAMPSRQIRGVLTQLGSIMPVLAVSTLITATAPTVTVTYKNQDGTVGRTATLTLPSNPNVNSAFLMSPHLQSGDTGIREVTNMSISAGSAGALKVYGLVPLAWNLGPKVAQVSTLSPIAMPSPQVMLEAGDKLALYGLEGVRPGIRAMVVIGGVGQDV